MKSKTKAELVKREEVDYWVNECKRLQEELDKYSTAYLDLESPIIDISDFKFKLSLDGLLTPQLEQFIHDYLKFYQEC